MENVDVERGIVHKTVQSLLDCVGKQLYVTNPLSPSIYMAPSTLRNLSPSSFKPRVVSIGPLHNNDENLQRFEVRKADFVENLLSRIGSSSTQTLTTCVEKVASMIEKIKGCYVDMKSYEYDDIELTKMMVMDACFILEFIQEISPGSIFRLQDQYIPYDLVLLENQIPFFVLKSIYECTICKFKKEPLPITEFILPLVKQIKLFEGRIKAGYGRHSTYTKYDHILGYMHHCYHPIKSIPSGFPSSTIHSAVELDSAGVNFRPSENPKWPMAMEVKWNRSKIFWYLFMPTLTMPKLRIDNFTESLFRNLIAYEQLHVADPYVTSYLRAMNMLIYSHEDIAKLVRSKLIVNHIGTNEEAANMINRMCKEVGQEHFYYAQQFEQLDKHFNEYLPRKTAKLKRAFTRLKLTYFNSPWSIIALFAGINLFILTWVQTIYTVKSSFTQKE